MIAEELNELVIRLLKSPENVQEFADIASIEENWRKLDKSIKIPSHIGIKAVDCPSCFLTVRLIFDKFSTDENRKIIICPHCKASIISRLEFTGYTSDIFLEEE